MMSSKNVMRFTFMEMKAAESTPLPVRCIPQRQIASLMVQWRTRVFNPRHTRICR
jgi:hypothetical protein